MNTKKITFIWSNDGWDGMYIDGKLVAQGHSLSVDQVLDALGIESDSAHADEEWLEDVGHLPDDLKDVKLTDA